jgi:hypothetical protein
MVRAITPVAGIDMGRHRKPTRLVVHAARIAVGGLVLAEITGGLPAIPAQAEVETPVVPAVYSTVQPVMTRHHHHSHHAHKAPPHLAQPVRVVQQAAVVAPAVAPAADPTAQDAAYDYGYDQLYDHYIVRQGDTLTHIAAEFGVSWEALFAINSDTIGDSPDSIYAGQILRLPA